MTDFFLFLIVGALAQLVDGALGMAYGLVSSTILISAGVAPATASASVHTAELFTTAASGTAHAVHRNIDWKLFWRLVPLGMLGGVVGTYLLTSFPGEVMKPFVALYLSLIGTYLLFRSFRRIPSQPVPGKVVPPLALTGGFLDSVGGGGWGPVVTSGLLGAGGQPRYVIGTVNTAEFLVTLAVSSTFLFTLLSGHWEEAGSLTEHGLAIGGLIVGGVAAAPFAGYIVKKLREHVLLRIVGCLILGLGLLQVVQTIL